MLKRTYHMHTLKHTSMHKYIQTYISTSQDIRVQFNKNWMQSRMSCPMTKFVNISKQFSSYPCFLCMISLFLAHAFVHVLLLLSGGTKFQIHNTLT